MKSVVFSDGSLTAGKRMRRIDGYGCKQRIQFFFAILVDEPPRLGVQLMHSEHANPVLCHRRSQRIPALILFIDKLVRKPRQNVAFVSQT